MKCITKSRNDLPQIDALKSNYQSSLLCIEFYKNMHSNDSLQGNANRIPN